MPRRFVEILSGTDVDAVFRLKCLHDGLAGAVEILFPDVGQVTAVGAGGTVDAVGAEIEQLARLGYPECAGVRPGVVHQSLEIGLAVFANPLAMGMLIEKLRAVAGEAVIEEVDPRDYFHALLMTRLDEGGRRVEVANDLGIEFHPFGALGDVGFHVLDDAGSGIRQRMLRVETGRV